MKRLSLYLSIFILILFTGCGSKEPVVPKIVYKTVEVKVPVYCKVPKIACDFKGTNFEPTIGLLKCIVEQKKALDVCRELK